MSVSVRPQPALARWLAHGVTSRTHPVLGWILARFFRPLGIEAEALEAEPFSALEAGSGQWWLRGPRWAAAGLDPAHPGAEDFGPLRRFPERFAVEVGVRGRLRIAPAAGFGEDPEIKAFFQAGDAGWRAARHAARSSEEAEVFLYAAAGLLLAGDPAAAVYARGDDQAFCAAVAEACGFSPQPGP